MPTDARTPVATAPSANAGGGAVDVRRERLADPVTGLPILRYRFAGRPSQRPGASAPAGIWRVLRAEERDGTTTLDLEHATGAERVDGRPELVDDALAEALLATLAAAAAHGLAHGDLGAHRVHRQGARVWLEGYGVPWRADATPTDDARSLAAALLELRGARLSGPMRARLADVRDGGPPTAGRAPDPAPPATNAPALSPAPSPASSPPSLRPSPPSSSPPASLRPSRPAGDAPAVRRGPPPGSRVRAGGAGVLAVARAQLHGLAARAAHGGAALGERAQRLVERAAGHRRPLLAVLLGGAILWWGLATWTPGAGPRATPPRTAPAAAAPRPGNAERPAAAHALTVRLEPAGHPPASLVVLASPAGSRHPPGAVIGSVPSVVTLDREGHWSFEARFAGERSGRAEAFVPFDRDLVVAFPAPAAAGP